jgi:hypothetical protein
MKRQGIFCDFELQFPVPGHAVPCPGIAIGACISCGKDVCATHGNARGIIVSVRYGADGGGDVEITSGACVLCYPCLRSARGKQDVLREFLLPGLLEQVSEGVKVTLAVDALKK